VSDDTAGEPTLGEVYWDTWGDGARKIPYPDLAVEYREHTERAAAAVGAAAIARLNQPEELRAAMGENVRLRKELHELTGQLADAVTPAAADFDHAADIASLTGQRNRVSDTADQLRAQVRHLRDALERCRDAAGSSPAAVHSIASQALASNPEDE
jgi:hypothetical protein